MSVPDLLSSVRFVVGRDGKPAAVQMDIGSWEALLEWIGDVEDREDVKRLASRLRVGPFKAGALDWDAAGKAWDGGDPVDRP